MIRSIRWRLQAWYALVLASVVVSFAAILYYRERENRFQEADAQLKAAAHYLDAALRTAPPHERTGLEPDGPPWPPPDDHPPRGRPPRRHGPPGRHPGRWREELTLPPGLGRPTGEQDRPYFAVWRADGTLLKADNLPRELTSAASPEAPPRPRLSWRGTVREVRLRGPDVTAILVGLPMQHELAGLHLFAWQLGGVGIVVLAIGLLGGWLVASRVLRPIAVISATAESISAADLSGRIDENVDSELAGLANVLNDMFDRLQAAFERQARFTADASHELRTPLAIIRSHAQLALSRSRTPEEYREALQTCLRAARRMTSLVEGLLTLARADASKLEVPAHPVELSQVVADCAALIRPLAADKRVSLRTNLAPVEVAGDADSLAQVVTNLLTNAIQYNRPGGQVRLELTEEEEEAVLAVADTGCGVPEEDIPHLFERFYRVDKARSRASGGNGLGLAICKSIVEAHGGTIGLQTEVGLGSTFWVRLPRGERPR
jgi:heavy metal sensor kinase